MKKWLYVLISLACVTGAGAQDSSSSHIGALALNEMVHIQNVGVIPAIRLTSKPLNNGMVFRIQSGVQEQIGLVLTDLWGRTIWSYQSQVNPGINQVVWNGHSRSGAMTVPGVYMLHMSSRNLRNSSFRTLDRKILFQ